MSRINDSVEFWAEQRNLEQAVLAAHKGVKKQQAQTAADTHLQNASAHLAPPLPPVAGRIHFKECATMTTYDFDREADSVAFRDRLIKLGWTVSHPWFDNHQWHVTTNWR